MSVNFRLSEYRVLVYRIFLGYVFYFVARFLFFIFNTHLFAVNGIGGFFRLCYYGIAFDTTALLYINSLFILLSILPLKINTRPGYQKGLMILYFVTNLLTYATNFIDIIYYRFSQVRLTKGALDLLSDETNKKALFGHFSWAYWYIIVIYIICCVAWIFLYRLVKVKSATVTKPATYFVSSAIMVPLIVLLMVGAIRGDFKHSTRPINMVDAYKHVTIPNQGDIILNTPFAIFRTLGSHPFKVEHWVDQAYIDTNIKPIKQYNSHPKVRPNIMVIILESMAREYWGSMNRETNIPGFR